MHTDALKPRSARSRMHASPPAETAAMLVAIGAVPGAWLRLRIVNHLEPMLPRRHWGTFGVNISACLALGLVAGLEQSCGAFGQRLLLLVATGFLGSYSTFSTFVVELFEALQRRQWHSSLLLGGSSVVAGLLALKLGLLLTAT